MLRRFALIIIIDGLNKKIFDEIDLPYIRNVIKDGFYSNNFSSIYPSLTFPAHTAIITGVKANKHGIVGNRFIDKGEIIDLDYYDANEFLQARTIYQFSSKLSLKSVAVNEPIVKGANLVFEKKTFDRMNFDKRFEVLRDKLKDIIKERTPSLLIINFSSFDTIGENFGPFNERIFSHLEDLDSYLAELEEMIKKIYNDYLLIITSDHGMTEVNDFLDIKKELEDIAIALPSHRVAHIYTEDKEEVLRRLKELGFSQIYEKKELKKIDLDNPRSGDFVVFAPAGIELEKKLKGSHGGASEEEMRVIFLVNKRGLAYDLKGEITDAFRIARRYLVETYALEEVEKRTKKLDPGHRIDHTLRVLKKTTKLGLKYGADLEILRLAAILHDIAREHGENHSKKSAELAKEILKFAEIDDDKIPKIIRIIEEHHDEADKLSSLESKILWDADKLDCLGLIGFVRALLESGFYNKGIDDAIQHVLRDTKLFLDGFHFDDTREEAKRKASEFKKFLSKLLIEIYS